MTLCLRAESITPCSCSQHSQLSSGCAVLERMGQCRATSAHLGDSHLRVNPCRSGPCDVTHVTRGNPAEPLHCFTSFASRNHVAKTRSGVGNLWPIWFFPGLSLGSLDVELLFQWMMMVVWLFGCLDVEWWWIWDEFCVVNPHSSFTQRLGFSSFSVWRCSRQKLQSWMHLHPEIPETNNSPEWLLIKFSQQTTDYSSWLLYVLRNRMDRWIHEVN